MKRIFKSRLFYLALLALAFFAVAITGIFLSLSPKKAKANTTNDFEYVEGASIRITDAENSSGLRFVVEFPSSLYNQLVVGGKYLSRSHVGMIIVPDQYYQDYKTAEAAGTATDYFDYFYNVKGKTREQISMQYYPNRLVYTGSTRDTYRISGAVVDILQKNLTLKYRPIAYYLLNGEPFYQPATFTASVTNVAQNALKDDSANYSDAQKQVLSGFVERNFVDVTLGTTSDNSFALPLPDATYTVENEAIATVENGVVTAKSAGTTSVTVSAFNGLVQTTFSVTVLERMEYSVKATVIPKTGTVMGAEFSLYDFDETDYAEMTATITPENGEPIPVTITEHGVIETELPNGTYTLNVDNNGYLANKNITVSGGKVTTSIAVPKDLKLGGSVGNAVSSYNENKVEVKKDSVAFNIKNGTSVGANNQEHGHVLVGLNADEITKTYYLEADFDFPGVNSFVGVIAAHENSALLNENGKALAFTYSGAHKVYVANDNTNTEFDVSGYFTNTAHDPYKHKIAILREGDIVYILLDDVLAGSYSCEEYGASGFGFISKSGPNADSAEFNTGTFTNIQYTVKADVVSEIKDMFVANAKLGTVGFMRPDGGYVPSFEVTAAYSINDDGKSGVLKNGSYVFADALVGNVYYVEATFARYDRNTWMGIMINPFDGKPSENKGWLGYGIYGNNALYLHEELVSWTDGTWKCAVNTGSGDWTLGVARVYDTYYVFVNGVLVLKEKVRQFTTEDHTIELPADHKTGFGLFAGGNGGEWEKVDIPFSNFKCTMNRNEIVAKVETASFTSHNGKFATVMQMGKIIQSGDQLIAGVPVTVKLAKSDTNVIGTLLRNGVAVEVEGTQKQFTFIPDEGAHYEFEVLESDAYANLTLRITSKQNSIGDSNYDLYDLTIDPSAVTVTVYNKNTEWNHTVSVAEWNTSELSNLPCGNYLVSVAYAGNVYEYHVDLREGDRKVVHGVISPVHLGGSVVSPNGTTITSFTSGVNFLNGTRDSVQLRSHTFSLHELKEGEATTKYYIEGIFDSTIRYGYGDYCDFGGLLVSHGPDELAHDAGDAKFMAGIVGNRVVIAKNEKGVSPWGTQGMRTIANIASVLTSYDPTAVKLGVLRDGTDYWFFVNDVYVGRYGFEAITEASGFGVVSTTGNCRVTVKHFNYSFNETYLNALKNSLPATQNSIDLYLVAGQSNAAGYSRFQTKEMAQYDNRLMDGVQNVLYAGKVQYTTNWTDGDPNIYDYGTTAYDWSLTTIEGGKAREHDAQGNVSARFFGPEAGIALELSKEYNTTTGKTAGILKFAKGGTALLDSLGGENSKSGNWVSPSYKEALDSVQDASKTGALYTAFIEEIQLRVSELRSMGYTDINIKGLYWMQGEADTWNPDEYKRAFGYFAKDIRDEVKKIDADASDMPIVVGEISRTFAGADAKTVETNERFIAMQRTLNSVAENVFVNGMGGVNNNDANGIIGSDEYHYNQADCLMIGRRVGDMFLNVTSKYEMNRMTSILPNADGSVNILSPATGDPTTYKYVVEKTQRTSFTAEATFVYTDGDFMGGFAIKQGDHTIYFALPRFNPSILLRENGSNFMYVPTKANLLGTKGSFFNGTSPSLTMRLTYANGIINLYYKDGNTYKEFIDPFNIADINASKGTWQEAEEWLGANMNASQPVQAGVAFFGDGSGVGTVNNFKVTANA